MDPVATHAKMVESQVNLDKQNRKGEFSNFNLSQKEFVGGGKVVRESRLGGEKQRKWTRNMGIWIHVRWTVGMMISVHLIRDQILKHTRHIV